MKTQIDMFDVIKGRQERDSGVGKISSGIGMKWIILATKIIADLPSGWIGTSEDVRPMILDRIGPPHHVNAWGALTLRVRRKGILIPTGKAYQAKRVARHANVIGEYRRS